MEVFAGDATYKLGTETYVAFGKKSQKGVRLMALKNTAYKFAILPEVPNLHRVKCQQCQHPGASKDTPVTSKEMDSSSQSSDPIERKDSSTSCASLDVSSNGQYRRLLSSDLSCDMCHHLLVILAQQNQVIP